MKISQQVLNKAVTAEILTQEQAQRLWIFFAEDASQRPRFDLTHLLYYLGGLIAIGAMTLFMNLGWERFGGWGIFVIALAYATAGLVLLHRFRGQGLNIPAGIMGAFVVAMAPLAIYGLQSALGFWVDDHAYRDYHRYISWNWLLMELASLAVGAILLWRYRLPFMVMPVAVTLWYLSMDLTPFLFSDLDHGWELRKLVSIYFGLLMTLLALWIDLRGGREKDFSFWLYLFGVTTFWGGLSLMHSDSELNKFIYLCINLAMLFFGAIIKRRVFAVFGGFGVAGYLGHLAYEVFKDSMLFPVVLSLLGLGVIYLGVIWQRNSDQATQTLRKKLPRRIRLIAEHFD